MSMLSTRNLRVLISALAIFGIVIFFATSQNSLTSSIQKVKPASTGDDTIPFNNDHLEEVGNTLQGSPIQGKEPPYSQSENDDIPVIGSNGKPKIVADKSANNEKAPAVGADSNIGTDSKPKVPIPANAAPAVDDEVLEKAPVPAAPVTPGKAAVGGAKCDEKNYVVMIDAGSTGSRVHVYEFDTCVSPPKLLKEEFKMLKPGLSSFDTDTKGAAASLDPLLEVALATVPKAKQGCTPVAVKATAGLRLLGKEKSTNILNEVRNHLEQDYPFAVVDGDGISIMEGKDEGVYAWITTNYLLGNIGNSEKNPTAAVFDLGGGSTQIVFEPEFKDQSEQMIDGEHKYQFTFGNREFVLYQFSHLGYGLMEGRNKINSLVIESALKTNEELQNSKIATKKEAKDTKSTTITLNNPCIPPGATASNVMVEYGKDEFYVVNFQGPSSDSGLTGGSQCRFLAEKILNKEAECAEKPCSFNGVHQPSLTKAFRKSNDMFVFSYFYDRTNPLGFPSSFTVEELKELAKTVCNGSQFWKDVLLDDPIKELNEEPQWCTDLSFITAMLHTGYDIPLGRELRTANKIDNNEIGWCLGASLPLLDGASSGWKCKVQDITA
ncbi:golgi guanosine diphosphatase [Scheffersomyces coipomensis]|uniref:golgi guanosine diphosphatase n=1 Tax=Scheffersomyces coipomensis TaxID=1788519 RepID=UPI00315DCEDD